MVDQLHADWECVVEQLQAKFVGNAEEARIRTPSLWQHHASTPSAEEFCQRAEDLVQARFRLSRRAAVTIHGDISCTLTSGFQTLCRASILLKETLP